MFAKPPPQKKKDDQDASDKRPKRNKKKPRKPGNEAAKSIDIRYRQNDSRKPQSQSSQAQCSLTMGESVWNPRKNAAESLFPNVEAVVNEQPSEEELIEQAILASMETLHEKRVIDAIPDDEAAEKFARNSDDEDTWGPVQRNLPTSEPEKDAKASDANNNSGLLDPSENLTVPAVKLQSRRSEIISGIIGNYPLVPSVTPKFIDKYGRVDGCTEKRLFMGKGARFKEEEYLRQQQQLLQSANSCSEVQDPHRDSASSTNSCTDLPASASAANSCTDLRASASSANSCTDLRASASAANSCTDLRASASTANSCTDFQASASTANSCTDLRASASSANSCQDLRASSQNSDRQTNEITNASAVQDFIDAAAQTLQANAANNAFSQDPAIIAVQFPRGSEEMLDQNFAEPSKQFPKESEEPSASSQQFDDPAEEFSAPEAPAIAQKSIKPLMETFILKAEVQEFYPKNYVHPPVQSAEFPESSQSTAELVTQSAYFPAETRDPSRQDFESQTRQPATSVSAHQDSGATGTSIASAGPSNDHQERRQPYFGQPANRGGYQEGGRNSNRPARESFGGLGRGSRSEQNAGGAHGRSYRNSYGGNRGDRGVNRHHENPNSEDYRFARHEQNPYKYENPYREDHRHEQNPHKYGGPNRDGQRSARPEQSQRYDSRDGQRGPRGYENRNVQGRPMDQQNRNVQGRPTDQQNRNVQGRPTDQQNRNIQGRPADQQNRNVQGRPADQQNRNVQGRPTDQQIREVQRGPMDQQIREVQRGPMDQQIREIQRGPTDQHIREVQRGPTDQHNQNLQGRPAEQNRVVQPRPAILQNREIPWGPTEQNPRKLSEGTLENSNNNYARVVSQNVQPNIPAAAFAEKPPIQQPKTAESQENIEGSVVPGEAKEPREAANVSVTEPPPFSSFNSRHTTAQIHELATEMPPTPPILMSPIERTTPPVHSALIPPPNHSVHPALIPPPNHSTHPALNPPPNHSVHPALIPPPNPSVHPALIPPPNHSVHPAQIPPPNSAAASLFVSPMGMTTTAVHSALIPPSNPPALAQPPRHNGTNGAVRVNEDPPMILPPFSEPPPGFHALARPAPQPCANCANCQAAASLVLRHASLRLNDPLLYKLLVDQREIDPRQLEMVQNTNASGSPSKNPRCSCDSQIPENPPEPTANPILSHQRAEDQGGQAPWGHPQIAQQFMQQAAHSVQANSYFPLQCTEAAGIQRPGRSECVPGKPPYSGNSFPENSTFASCGVDSFHEHPAFAGRVVDPAAQPYFPASRTYEAVPRSANVQHHPDEYLRFAPADLRLTPRKVEEMQMQYYYWMQQQMMLGKVREFYGDDFAPQMANYPKHGQPLPVPFPPQCYGHDAARRCNVDTGNPEANHQPHPPDSSVLYSENPPPVPQSEGQPTGQMPHVMPIPIVGRGRGRLDSMAQKN